MGLIDVYSKSQRRKISAYTLDDIFKEIERLKEDKQFKGLDLKQRLLILYGKRSNGKTYAGSTFFLKRYLEHGERSVWQRRLYKSFDDPKVRNMFDNAIIEGVLEGTQWDGIDYLPSRGGWTLYHKKIKKCKDGSEEIQKLYEERPFLYSSALFGSTKDKGGQFTNVFWYWFDEFLAKPSEMGPHEVDLIIDQISTIQRYSDDVTFILAGNTVNTESPYFDELGVDITEIEPGMIKSFVRKDGYVLSVEHIESPKESKMSDGDKLICAYFKHSSKVKMVTEGEWEFDEYPMLPEEFGEILPKESRKTFFLVYGKYTLRIQMVRRKDEIFLYVDFDETRINPDKDIIFSNFYDTRRNWFRKFSDFQGIPIFNELLRQNKIFYENRVVGTIFQQYLKNV